MLSGNPPALIVVDDNAQASHGLRGIVLCGTDPQLPADFEDCQFGAERLIG